MDSRKGRMPYFAPEDPPAPKKASPSLALLPKIVVPPHLEDWDDDQPGTLVYSRSPTTPTTTRVRKNWSVVAQGQRNYRHALVQTEDVKGVPYPSVESLGLSPHKGNVLCEKAKEIVRRVLAFNQDLCRLCGDQCSILSDPVLLTARMVGISVDSISTISCSVAPVSKRKKIAKPVNNQLPLPPCRLEQNRFHTEKTRSARLVTKFEPMVLDFIRRFIHTCYNTEKRIVISELNEILTTELSQFEFKIKDRTLTRLLKGIGFRYQKVRDRCVLYERSDLIEWRARYLKQMSDFRSGNAYISYADETWLFAGMKYPYDWVDLKALEDPMKFRKDFAKINPVPGASRGKRAILIGVIGEEGILENCFEIWGSGMSDDKDYHHTLNGQLYEQWLTGACKEIKKQAGNRKAVLVVDNAPYHSEVVEKIPTKSSKKEDICAYLTKNGVCCSTKQKKAQLVPLLESFLSARGGRSQLRKYKIDVLAAKHEVTIVRLPPYHCTLNPIEFYWGWLKGKLSRAATSDDKLEQFRANALKFIKEMPAETKRKFFDHAEKMENDFIKKDHLVFVDVQPLIVPLEDDSSDSEFDSDSDDDLNEYDPDGDRFICQEERDRVTELIANAKYRKN